MIAGWHTIRRQAVILLLTAVAGCAGAALFSCNNSKQAKAPASDSNTVYYPVNNYIRQQAKAVDTIPYYLYRIRITNGKKDSATISRSIFDSLVKQFLLPDLEVDLLKKNFSESVYEDESTSSFTLTYTPKNSTSSVQNAMVLLDTASQQVKWIFVNTLQNGGDSTVIQKIGWKGDASCYLNRSVSYADGRKNETQLSLVWNERE